MGRLARSRKHRSIRDNQRKFRTRARTKDIDQIHEDLAKVEAIREARVFGDDLEAEAREITTGT